MKPLSTIRLGVLMAALTMALPMACATDASASVATLPARLNLSGVRSNTTFHRFIVTYRNGTTERSSPAAAVQNVSVAVARAGINKASLASKFVNVSFKRKLASGSSLLTTSRALNTAETQALVRQIAADPTVEHVEPDYMMQAITDVKAADTVSFTPNDPGYAGYQWDFQPGNGSAITVTGDSTSYADYGGVDLPKAWSLADGTGVTIAVIDTGLTHHPDLDTSLGDAGYDFISDSFVSGRDTDYRAPGGWDLGDWTTGDAYLASNGGCVDSNNPAEDSSWHGTHVAGTATELTNNSTGLAGTAYNAKVLPLRVLGHCGGYTSDIADAIEWASGGTVDGVPANTHVAQVINMSLGGSGTCSPTDETGKAISDAIGRGTTVVVAAGNSGDDAAYYTPSSCPGVIAVGSVGITGKRAFYSNYGSTVTIAAPGGGIYANDAASGTEVDAGFVWSTLNGGTTTPDESNYVYGGFAGTSQATPHVAGTVALILSATNAAGLPAPSPAAIGTLLTSTAHAFPSTPDQPLGTGIVDAYQAVSKAIGNDTSTPDPGAIALANGILLTGQKGDVGESLIYALSVPQGAKNLSLRSLGGTGDVSMYVSIGSAPAADGSDATYKSVKAGNNESVVLSTPTAGTYYIRLVGVKAFANVSVLGNFKAP